MCLLTWPSGNGLQRHYEGTQRLARKATRISTRNSLSDLPMSMPLSISVAVSWLRVLEEGACEVEESGGGGNLELLTRKVGVDPGEERCYFASEHCVPIARCGVM